MSRLLITDYFYATLYKIRNSVRSTFQTNPDTRETMSKRALSVINYYVEATISLSFQTGMFYSYITQSYKQRTGQERLLQSIQSLQKLQMILKLKPLVLKP